MKKTIKNSVPVPTKDSIETTHFAKYQFSPAELATLAVAMAAGHREKKEVEDELQGIKSSFKARLDALDAKINKASTDYGNGYEHRQMQCVLSFDFDKKRRTYRRQDNGTIVGNEPLRPEDYQVDAFINPDGDQSEK